MRQRTFLSYHRIIMASSIIVGSVAGAVIGEIFLRAGMGPAISAILGITGGVVFGGVMKGLFFERDSIPGALWEVPERF